MDNSDEIFEAFCKKFDNLSTTEQKKYLDQMGLKYRKKKHSKINTNFLSSARSTRVASVNSKVLFSEGKNVFQGRSQDSRKNISIPAAKTPARTSASIPSQSIIPTPATMKKTPKGVGKLGSKKSTRLVTKSPKKYY